MSTDFYRTIQSGYSELLGMLHTLDRPRLRRKQIIAPAFSGMPPFRVRRQNSIAKDLGEHAIVAGFVSIPIYLTIDAYFENDLSANGCENYLKVRGARSVSPIPFLGELHTVKVLAPAFAKIFNSSFHYSEEQFETMNFQESQRFGDMAYAEHFEF
jgi:hypothetical protein